jgi:hypothetical protein
MYNADHFSVYLMGYVKHSFIQTLIHPRREQAAGMNDEHKMERKEDIH